MTGLLSKIQNAVHNRTTYRTGLLQDKAYRVLKSFTTEALAIHRISTVEWALLGLLKDHGKGITPTMLATELGVEAPFISVLVVGLTKQGYVTSIKNEGDSRSKKIHLTETGNDFVETVERDLRHKVRTIISGISTSDLVTYLSVLQKIIDNSQKHS